VKTPPAGIIHVVVNVVLGLIFVHSGAAGWLWARVEPAVSWRTGPTAVGVLTYFAIFWSAWMSLNLVIHTVCHPEALRRIWHRSTSNADPSAYLRMTGVAVDAGKALVMSCVLVVIQVLMPRHWLVVALGALLIAMLIDAYIIREPLRRTITAWAWTGAGVALATLLIHPYFVGLPLFVVRLTVVMTIWDWLGERLGVTPRLVRFVPSLYSASGCTADHARVAR
jgi:hypothetical protein